MNTVSFREQLVRGMWKENPVAVQGIGLCPLLAVSHNMVSALGLGLATLLVVVLTNVTVSCCRRWIPPDIRIPIYVTLIAGLVTVIELLLQAFALKLHQSIGIFMPLIITNCIVISRAEAFASKQGVGMACRDGLATGLGFCSALLLLGTVRELLGTGGLLGGAEQFFGSWAKVLHCKVFNPALAGLIATATPGAFILLGLLAALKQWIDSVVAQKKP